MKFTVKRDALLGPLQLAAGVVERRQTMPVLANILFVLTENQLSLTGSDNDVEIVGRLDLEWVSDTGEITVPARKLVDICRSLPDDASIEIALLEDQRLLVKSGRSRFTLSTMPANNFPVIEISEGDIQFTCQQFLIKRLIDRTAFAMAQQDVRYYLNGMLWETENNQLRCVATDGHRLAMCTRELDIQAPNKTQAILPRKGVIEISRLLKEDEADVKVTITGHHMRIETTDYTLTSTL
ncbi:MAG: DNA polymerase III subunit beta, partial [Pseudomonadota bacterium]